MAITFPFKLTKTYILRNLALNGYEMKTAGILVIGDELLKGQVTDANSPIIAKKLHNLGVKVKRISIIGDEVNEISNLVRLFSDSYDYVITTGGLGPTHDDVTFEAVAQAFNVPLVMNPELRKICERFYETTDINHPGMKLARIPETSKLNFSDEKSYPNVSIKNVYLFPGIPELFRKSFTNLSSKLFSSKDTHFYTKYLYVNVTEDKISEELSKIVNEFPQVQVGSYPELFNELFKVKITLEATDEKLVTEAFEKLQQRLSKEAIVDVNK